MRDFHSYMPRIIAGALLCAALFHVAPANAQNSLNVIKIGPCELVQSDGGANASVGGWVRGLCDGKEITAVNGTGVRTPVFSFNAVDMPGPVQGGVHYLREVVIGEAKDFTPLVTVRLAGGTHMVLASYKDFPCPQGRSIVMRNYGAVPAKNVTILGHDAAQVLGVFEGAACVATR